MENPSFIDEENIPLVNQGDDEEDYDERYDTLSTSTVDERSFTVPTETMSTLRLRQIRK